MRKFLHGVAAGTVLGFAILQGLAGAMALILTGDAQATVCWTAFVLSDIPSLMVHGC